MDPAQTLHNGPRSRDFYFAVTGFLFLIGSLCLVGLTGYVVSDMVMKGVYEEFFMPAPDGQARNTGYMILGVVLLPMICFAAAMFCAGIGIKLLRSAGVVATPEVISARDYEILAPAIRDANAEAITQWIRLNSLSGVTGTFTKIGLSGLPLATIALTLFLSILGLVSDTFFDLAKLTLGAFLGSYVQRQADASVRAPADSAASKVRPT